MRSSVSARQIRPRPSLAMKLTAAGVTLVAAARLDDLVVRAVFAKVDVGYGGSQVALEPREEGGDVG